MRTYSVLSLIGPDRPGIVDEVSHILAAGSCNIEDSRMAVLGGEFGLLMLLSGEPEAAKKAVEAAKRWAEAQKMLVIAKPTKPPAQPEGASARISLEIPDRPGIVNKVSHFLAEHGANVESLQTSVIRAPFTGTPIFSMNISVSSGGKLPIEQLRGALHSLAEDEDITIAVDTRVAL